MRRHAVERHRHGQPEHAEELGAGESPDRRPESVGQKGVDAKGLQFQQNRDGRRDRNRPSRGPQAVENRKEMPADGEPDEGVPETGGAPRVQRAVRAADTSSVDRPGTGEVAHKHILGPERRRGPPVAGGRAGRVGGTITVSRRSDSVGGATPERCGDGVGGGGDGGR